MKLPKCSGFTKLILVILGGVAAYTVITLSSQHALMAKQLARTEELEKKREEITREIEFRKRELNFIGSEEYIEQQARIRLGWLYPDEIKFVESEDAPEGEIIIPKEMPSPSPSAEVSAENNANTEEPQTQAETEQAGTEQEGNGQTENKEPQAGATDQPSPTPYSPDGEDVNTAQ